MAVPHGRYRNPGIKSAIQAVAGWSAELRLLEWWVDHQQILARTIVSHRFLENEQFNAFLGYLWYKRSETRGWVSLQCRPWDQKNECGDDVSLFGTGCGDGDGSRRGGLSFDFRVNVASSCELILHTLQLTRLVYKTSSSGNLDFVGMYLKGACICWLMRTRQPTRG